MTLTGKSMFMAKPAATYEYPDTGANGEPVYRPRGKKPIIKEGCLNCAESICDECDTNRGS